MHPTAVVDTNIWVSALLNPTGAPARLLSAARLGRFDIVTSTPLLEELAQVLARPRLLRVGHLDLAQVRDYVQLISRIARLASVTGSVKACRDPDDDVVLETALSGGAGYLVTRDGDMVGDPDLVAAFAARGVEIITVARFLELV